jgi:hypothetical protein
LIKTFCFKFAIPFGDFWAFIKNNLFLTAAGKRAAAQRLLGSARFFSEQQVGREGFGEQLCRHSYQSVLSVTFREAFGLGDWSA